MTGRDLLAVVEHELSHRGMLDRPIEWADLVAFCTATLLPAVSRAMQKKKASAQSRV